MACFYRAGYTERSSAPPMAPSTGGYPQNPYDGIYGQQPCHNPPHQPAYYYGGGSYNKALPTAPLMSMEPSPRGTYGSYPMWSAATGHPVGYPALVVGGAGGVAAAPPMPVVSAPQPADNCEEAGGVSSSLDYEFSEMADFLSSMAHGIMVTAQHKWDSSNLASLKQFLVQVLTATRLPRSTIILALVYISKRWAIMGQACPASDQVYKMVVVGLVLANKFHDDNTFTNSSWFKATHIPVAEITTFESQWLRDIKWSLHLDGPDAQAWYKWDECWQMFIRARTAFSESPMAPSQKSPIVSSDYMDHSSPLMVSPASNSSPAYEPASPNFNQQRQYTIPRWYETALASTEKSQAHRQQQPFVSHFGSTVPVSHASYAPYAAAPVLAAPAPMVLQPPHIYSGQQYFVPMCDANYSGYTPNGYSWNHSLMDKKTDWFSVAAC